MTEWPTHRHRAAKRRAMRAWKQRKDRQERRRVARSHKGATYRAVSR